MTFSRANVDGELYILENGVAVLKAMPLDNGWTYPDINSYINLLNEAVENKNQREEVNDEK